MRLAPLAPGKVNLCLFVGRPRQDGLHPVVSIVQPLPRSTAWVMVPSVTRPLWNVVNS